MTQSVYRIFGTRRSGNHAIIDWMIKNVGTKDVLHLNDCRNGVPPERAYAELSYQGQRYGLKIRNSPETIAVAAKAHEAACLFVSYENKMIAPALNKRGAYSVGFDDKITKNIIITRDFLNWLASYHKLMARNLRTQDMTLNRITQTLNGIACWKDCIGLANNPKLARVNCEAVSYDDWFQNDDYRKQALGRLGLVGDDISLPPVSDYGGGSSFDGLAKDKSATDLQTSERWRNMVGDPQCETILKLLLGDRDSVSFLSKHSAHTLETLKTEFNLHPSY